MTRRTVSKMPKVAKQQPPTYCTGSTRKQSVDSQIVIVKGGETDHVYPFRNISASKDPEVKKFRSDGVWRTLCSRGERTYHHGARQIAISIPCHRARSGEKSSFVAANDPVKAAGPCAHLRVQNAFD